MFRECWPARSLKNQFPYLDDFETRAVYLTGLMAGSDHGLRIIRRWRELGGNAVVFDVKDSDGSINIPFDNPLAGPHHITSATCRSLPNFYIRKACMRLPVWRFFAMNVLSLRILSWR